MTEEWALRPADFTPYRYSGGVTERDILQYFPHFAFGYLKIRTKEKRLSRFRLNNAQMAYFARRGKRNLILKARQLGFSTLVQGQMYHEACTIFGYAGLMLSHNDEATQRLRRIFARYWNEHPEPRPIIGRNSDMLTTFPGMDAEITISTAGGGRAGRGGTMSRIHCSEVAFWTDPEGILSGAMQGGDPALDLESTPNGAAGYFYERCISALDGDRDWVLHFFPWWWDNTYRVPIDLDDGNDTAPWTEEERLLAEKHGLDELQINWRRHKQRELRHLFIQEYPEDPFTCFLTSGGSFFGNIADAFNAPIDSKPEPPFSNRRYVGGLDWGQASDYTVLHIGDVITKSQVFLMRINKMRWSEMRGLILEACKYWRVWELYPEANSIGGPNLEELEKEFQAQGLQTSIKPFYLTAANKGPMLTVLASALQNGEYHLQNIPEQRAEFNSFLSQQTASNHWTYGAAKGGHDDTVIAGMACYAGMSGALDVGLKIGSGPAGLSDYRG